MTVGVAAILTWYYDDENGEATRPGRAIVTASDRMLTAEPAQIEHTLHVLKGNILNKHNVLLAAGDITVHNDLIRDLFTFINQAGDTLTTKAIADEYGRLARAYKARKAEEYYLSPLKMTTEVFVERQAKMNQNIVDDLTNKIQNYHLGIEAVIAGMTGENAHLFYVDPAGMVTCHDDFGYVTVGIGGTHAAGHFMVTSYSSAIGYFDALWAVFSAKRRGEIAPGVGDFTDMVRINEHGALHIPPDLVAKMAKVHTDTERKRAAMDREASKLLAKAEEQWFKEHRARQQRPPEGDDDKKE